MGGTIITHQSVAGYFKEQLDQLCRHRRVELTEDAAFYVVNLLTEFARADRLFLPAEDARHRELTPLAELRIRAQDSSGETRARILRHLGDSSLYIAGFFQDRVENSAVDVDYYVSMGGTAYNELSATWSGRESTGLRRVFAELAEKFGRVMELLCEMAQLGLGVSESAAQILNAYEKWLRTGSQAVARNLRRRGVLSPAAKVVQ